MNEDRGKLLVGAASADRVLEQSGEGTLAADAHEKIAPPSPLMSPSPSEDPQADACGL